jgi:hypothetical protein
MSPRKFKVQEVDCIIPENQGPIKNAESLAIESIFAFCSYRILISIFIIVSYILSSPVHILKPHICT